MFVVQETRDKEGRYFVGFVEFKEMRDKDEE
jgi:hypothetical protein